MRKASILSSRLISHLCPYMNPSPSVTSMLYHFLGLSYQVPRMFPPHPLLAAATLMTHPAPPGFSALLRVALHSSQAATSFCPFTYRLFNKEGHGFRVKSSPSHSPPLHRNVHPPSPPSQEMTKALVFFLLKALLHLDPESLPGSSGISLCH